MAFVALAAAVATTSGCGPEVIPIDTDVFFVGVSASQQELTVAPGTRIELGVYRVMSNGGIALTTRNTEVDYHVDPPVLKDQQTAVVEAGVLVAYYGTFLVSAVDNTQFFHDAQPLVVHVSDGAPVPLGTTITIVIPGISGITPVIVGNIYILPAIGGIDWTLIPPGGINVFWHKPGDGDILVGTITLVGGVPQLVFNQTGIAVIAGTFAVGTIGSVEVNFNINLTQTQTTQIAFTIWVTGTGPVTPPPPAGGDASAIVNVESAPPKEVE